MASPDDPSLAGHLAAARRALEQENLSGAARHVAAALGEDPNRSEVLTLLDEILAATDDPMELVPDDDLPSTSGQVALHAYILAEQGRVPEAVDKLLGVIGERPDVLYIDWVLGWLQRPEAAGRLDLGRLTNFVGSLVEEYPALTAPHSGGRDTLARMPLFIQLVRRSQPADSTFLVAGIALLRRMGNLDEALKLAREAYALQPGLDTAVALAATYANRDELDQALQTFRDALVHEPGDISVQLHMADLLVHRDRLKEAREIYAEVLEREENQEVAQPSYCFLRFIAGDGEEWRDKLLALADEQPDNERAQRLAQQVTPYLGFLPDPPDVTARIRKPTGDRGGPTMLLTSIEAPSNYLAFDWLRKIDVRLEQVPEPDPRQPRCRVDHVLWRYEEEDRPRVVIAPPDADVAHAVAELASQPYRLDVWWGQARRLASRLGESKLEDLLGTMVYPPGITRVERPVPWVFRLQVAAALVIAHLDDGWQESLRRSALLSLANGPMDWTVDAALVALAALAREEEDAAPEIARLFRELRKGVPADGTICYYPALLWCSLRAPGLEEDERVELRQRLRKWQDARAAEEQYRQALVHAEKGELDRAITALTNSVRLDPAGADAFRERGALWLRRADPAKAVADFTQAIQLQPNLAAAYLGRGQAHLKLGRIEQALDDFSAATRLAPGDWQPWYRRGLAHTARKMHEQAVADFTEVIRLAPTLPDAYLQRALAYTQLGQLYRAIEDYTEQLTLNPESPLAYNFRARLRYRLGDHGAALADHLRASELDPGNANTYAYLAWIWATSPDAAVRDGRRAQESALKACELTDWKKVHCVDALAAAHAENGRFEEAVQWAQRAVELAPAAERSAYLGRLETYQQSQPWRDK
jgi:tetratricopeptide (TPR) repeat protein